MAYGFNCPYCGNEIITHYLKIGDTALCKSCKKNCIVPVEGKQAVPSDTLSNSNIEMIKPAITGQVLLASQGQRFGNYILDILFIYILAFIVGIIFALIGHSEVLLRINNYILGAILFLIYYVPQEAYSGRTLGKLITKTKAVNEDGSEISLGQAVGRTLCRFIPFEAFSFLGGKGRPRGWHDKLSNTVVITLK